MKSIKRGPVWLRYVRTRQMEGMRIPQHVGYSYRDFDTNCAIFHLWPFNWLARFWQLEFMPLWYRMRGWDVYKHDKEDNIYAR